MPLTGKYDFKGIKRLGAAGIRRALALSPYTAWLLSFGGILDLALQALSNFLANFGLVILNVGGSYVDGEFDQKGFDDAMNESLAEVELKDGKLTPADIKRLDDAVIKKARKLIVIARP